MNASYVVGESCNLEFSATSFNHIYVGSGNQLWETYDDGGTFDMIYDFGEKVVSVQVGRSDENIMYVSTWAGWWDTKKVFRSTNGGLSWVQLTPAVYPAFMGADHAGN